MKKATLLFFTIICIHLKIYSQFNNLLPAPIIPGLQEVSDDFQKTLISQKLINELHKEDYPIPDKYVSIKNKTLTCFYNVTLFEINAYKNDTVCLYYLLMDEDNYYLINGKSRIIHELNDKKGVTLNNPRQTFEYLYLFVHSLSHNNSRFRIIQNADELKPYMHSSIPKDIIIEEPSIESDSDGNSYISANVLYYKSLYKAKFTIPEDGKVNMIDDYLIAELDIMYDAFSDGCIRFQNLLDITELSQQNKIQQTN